MSVKGQTKTLTQIFLGEIAVLDGTTLDYIERLEGVSELVDKALTDAREDYYRSEVNKQK